MKKIKKKRKKQIEEGEKLIADNEKKLKEGQKAIEEGSKKIEEEEAKLKQATQGFERIGMSVNELSLINENLHNTYQNAINTLQTLTTNRDEILAQVEINTEIVNASEYSNSRQVLEVIQTLEPSEDDPTYLKLVDEYNAFVFLETYQGRLDFINAQIFGIKCRG